MCKSKQKLKNEKYIELANALIKRAEKNSTVDFAVFVIDSDGVLEASVGASYESVLQIIKALLKSAPSEAFRKDLLGE